MVSTRSARYALTAGALAAGAPAGLFLLRAVRGRTNLRSPVSEVRHDLDTYLYVGASTMLAFVLFGGTVGRFADRLAQLATTDPLTGLLNSRAFNERMHVELERAIRFHEPLSLLFADVDALKRINDQFGHAAGDAALQTVAASLRTSLREIDAAARIGGDEFAVLVPKAGSAEATVLANRLRAQVESHPGVGGLTISIGVASAQPVARSDMAASLLVAAADAALYDAKRAGRNAVSTAAL